MIARRAALAVLLFAGPARVSAQPAAPPDPWRKWEIVDNSFLVEEAFNQETGVVQNIFQWVRGQGGGWSGNFTQEWPAPGMRHQLSYSLAYTSTGAARGFGDVMLNYRFQLREEDAAGPAIAPRLSVILPTGNADEGLGGGRTGLDVNLPVSKQFGDFYVHANAGYTWLPGVLGTTRLAGSGIWRAAPMFNVMLEGLVLVHQAVTLSPGFRYGWNVGARQLVVGLAAPVTRADSRSTVALLAYLSYELPFR